MTPNSIPAEFFTGAFGSLFVVAAIIIAFEAKNPKFMVQCLKILPVAFGITLVAYVASFYVVWNNPDSPGFHPLIAHYWWNPILVFSTMSFLTMTVMLPVAMPMAAMGMLGYKDD